MPEGKYPPDWDYISRRIRERAGGQCECTGECALHRGDRCVEMDGHDAQFASGRVVLTVAHLNHCKSDCRDRNLLAMCNTCHLRYDMALHMRNAFASRADDRTIDMFGGRDNPRRQSNDER